MAAAPISVNNTDVLTLPLLKTETRYNGMPRRYEDTKPVVIQNFTHRYIMDLGAKYHRTSQEKFEVEKSIAVKSAEEALWSRAEILRQESIEKALEKAKAAYERDLKKQQRAHEKVLKDALFKLQQELQLQAADELREEKEAAEKRLREAVEETEKRCEKIKVKAIADARKEERQKSIQEIEDLKHEFQEKFTKAEERWKEDKVRALVEMKIVMTHEKELAVAVARHEDDVSAQESLAKLKKLHESAVRVLKTYIEELKSEIEGLQNDIKRINYEKKFVEQEVLLTRECFQDFVDGVKPFEPGKSDYVIPPMRMMRTESLLEFDLPRQAKKNAEAKEKAEDIQFPPY